MGKPVFYSLLKLLAKLPSVNLLRSPNSRRARHRLLPMRHQSLRPRHDRHRQDEIRRKPQRFIHERREQIRVGFQAPRCEILVLLRNVVNGKRDLEQGVAVHLLFELVEHLFDEDGAGIGHAVYAMSVAEKTLFFAFDAVDLGLCVGRAADLGDVLVGDLEGAAVQDAIESRYGGNESGGCIGEGGTGLQQSCGRARHFVVCNQDPELLDAAHILRVGTAGGWVDMVHHPEHVLYVAHGRIWLVVFISGVVAVAGGGDDGHVR